MKNDDISINDTVMFDDEKYVVASLHFGRIDDTLDLYSNVYAKLILHSIYNHGATEQYFRVVRVSELKSA